MVHCIGSNQEKKVSKYIPNISAGFTESSHNRATIQVLFGISLGLALCVFFPLTPTHPKHTESLSKARLEWSELKTNAIQLNYAHLNTRIDYKSQFHKIT